MVREVRFAWEDGRPDPPEISRVDWECEDLDLPESESRSHSRRPRKKRGIAKRSPIRSDIRQRDENRSGRCEKRREDQGG